MKKQISILISVIFLASINLFAQIPAKSFDPNYKIIFHNPVQDKLFYVLSSMQNQSDLRKSLRKNETLASLGKQHLESLRNAANCNDVNCYDKAFRLNEVEIEMIAKVFEGSTNDKRLRKLVENHLRPSGLYVRYDDKSDAEMLAAAWRDAAKGINHILDVFGLGKDSLYKEIDNASFDVNGAEYPEILKTKVAEIKPAKNTLFFEPTLAFAMKLLEANGRDEVGRHERLEVKDNKKAFENLKKIKWNDYPYSVILVLGSGPSEKLGDAPNIGKIGMLRADEAVKLFKQKLAPLLVLSGGYVHPARTPYCEAVEMKKYIMQKYGIAESSILIEPQARHTTTNVRNAERLMFRDKIPTDKLGLITSSETHIDYVGGNAFKKRFTDEIGFVPMQIFKRISPVAIEFMPLKESLFVNPSETLDP
jgi:hypothetical protein